MVTICFDYSSYSDRSHLESSFKQAGFRFRSKGGFASEVWDVAGEKTMRIMPPGLIINFEAPAREARIRIGVWDGKTVHVNAFDSSRVIVASGTATGPAAGTGQFTDLVLTANDMVRIEIDTPGKEDYLASICIDVCYQLNE